MVHARPDEGVPVRLHPRKRTLCRRRAETDGGGKVNLYPNGSVCVTVCPRGIPAHDLNAESSLQIVGNNGLRGFLDFIAETANLTPVFKRAAAGALDWLSFQTKDTNSDSILFVGGAITVSSLRVSPGGPGSRTGSRREPVRPFARLSVCPSDSMLRGLSGLRVRDFLPV